MPRNCVIFCLVFVLLYDIISMIKATWHRQLQTLNRATILLAWFLARYASFLERYGTLLARYVLFLARNGSFVTPQFVERYAN